MHTVMILVVCTKAGDFDNGLKHNLDFGWGLKHNLDFGWGLKLNLDIGCGLVVHKKHLRFRTDFDGH